MVRASQFLSVESWSWSSGQVPRSEKRKKKSEESGKGGGASEVLTRQMFASQPTRQHLLSCTVLRQIVFCNGLMFTGRLFYLFFILKDLVMKREVDVRCVFVCLFVCMALIPIE